jgi:hypothetical protein
MRRLEVLFPGVDQRLRLKVATMERCKDGRL